MIKKKNLAQFIIVTLALGILAVVLFLPSIRNLIFSQNGFGITAFGIGFGILIESILRIGFPKLGKPFWVLPVLVILFSGVVRTIEMYIDSSKDGKIYDRFLFAGILMILFYFGIAFWSLKRPETPQNQEH